MWLDSSEWSIALPVDFALTYVEHFIQGKPIECVVIRRGETTSARGIDVEQRSEHETYITLNEQGAHLLRSIGVAVLRVDGNRMWLRTSTGRPAAEIYA